MAKTYKNPPLKEAVCEFRFELGNVVAEAQILAFYEKVKDIFPVQKKGRMHQIEMQLKTDGGASEAERSTMQNFHEFNIYLSEGGENMIQMDGGRISFHRLSPYTSWAEFFPIVQKMHQSYIECFNPVGILRIGLRYVNEIVLPAENFEYKKYFQISLVLPNLIEETQKSILIASIFEQEKGRDMIKVQFGDKPVALDKSVQDRAFLLDFDYSSIAPNSVAFDKIDEWVTVAHENLEKTFEEVLTNETKAIFQ